MTSLPPTNPYFPHTIQRKLVPTLSLTPATPAITPGSFSSFSSSSSSSAAATMASSSKGSLGSITVLSSSSITPTPTSTPSNPVYNTPIEARYSPFITTYPTAYSYTSHPYKMNNFMSPGYPTNSFSVSTTTPTNNSNSTGYGHSRGRSKSQKSRHFSRSGGGFISPQSSPLIQFNIANGDSPTSMSPYDQSPSRSGSITAYSDLTQQLNRLSLNSPSKRIHPRKGSEEDDDDDGITSCNSNSNSNTSTAATSSSSDNDSDSDDDDTDTADDDDDDDEEVDDDGVPINMCLSSSTSTGGTDNFTKSYDGTIGDDEDDDVVLDVDNVENSIRSSNDAAKNGHSRSMSSEFVAQGSDAFAPKLVGSLSSPSYSAAAPSVTRWKTPKLKKMRKFSQSMGVLPQIFSPKTRYPSDSSPRLTERETASSSSSSSSLSFPSGGSCGMLFSRSTILLPPSPRLFRDEARGVVATVAGALTPVHDLPDCEEAEARGEDPTRYAGPDDEHVLEWSNEGKGLFTSADSAYEVLRRYYAGDRTRFQEVLVLDCRYEYEYAGGHIRGAVSVTPPNVVERVHKLLFKKYPRLNERTSDTCMVKESSSLLILVYCEFSSQRGPLMYSIIKAMDRSFFKYPWVKYRNLFLIKGGYEMFFKRHPDMCTPCGYVEMKREGFEDELRRWEDLYEVERQVIAKQLECFKSYSLSNSNAVEVSCSPDRFL